ncbi:MAG: hypothetical protein ABI905_12010 [Betaproteobacteria bacterium]
MTTNVNTNKASGSYSLFPSPMKSYFLSVVAIVAAAGPAVWLAWLAMTAVGLEGIPLALATAVLGMVLAVLFFATLVAVGKAIKFVK